MKSNRVLVFSGYVLAFSVALIPLYDTLSSAFPVALGDPRGRFSLVGLLTQSALSPLMGWGLAVGLALGFEHRGMLRFLSVMAGLGALIALVLTPLFMLDALAMREQVSAQASRAFDFASAGALFKLSVVIVASGGMAVGGWLASRKRRKGKEEGTRRTTKGLVIGASEPDG